MTVMQATPATWRLLLESGWEGSAGLKVLCGGEALPRDLADALLPRCGELWNLYGPTETTIWSSKYRVTQESGSILIGRPIDNTRIYILDEHLGPVPLGVYGDLYIGGAGLARGYLNRPELSAERFIADPFSEKADARMYQTGDLARYRADGNIEYLGRSDHQVKLRGFRIELGEIETVLAEHADINAAVAVIREDIPANPQLVAYVTGLDEKTFDAEALKDYLLAHLPQYMVPSSIVLLDKWPLTANGKIDRKALPDPLENTSNKSGQLVLPRNHTEQTITDILKSLLNVNVIGVTDNFFRLGGHSLLAIRAVNEINAAFAAGLSNARFMTLATVEKLAREIQAGEPQLALKPLLARVDLTAEEASYALSFAQERLWYIHALYPDIRAAYNISAYIQLDTSISKIKAILRRLQQQYAILRTTYTLDGVQPVQKIHQDVKIPLQILELSEFDESAEAEQRIVDISREVFDLETGPVWRCIVLKQGERALGLSVTIHHIATDGWSMNLLKQEILGLCQQDDIETEISKIKPGIQYVDYALWHREQLDPIGSRFYKTTGTRS